jgi:hypothetical protein
MLVRPVRAALAGYCGYTFVRIWLYIFIFDADLYIISSGHWSRKIMAN